jgi:hypothetical protein
MRPNPILETKYKTQKQLTEEAQYDIAKYVENSHSIVRAVEAQYGVKFNYGVREGGEAESLVVPHRASNKRLQGDGE